MKKRCKNCHFLSKEHRNEKGDVHNWSLSRNERSDLEKDPETFVAEYFSLNCYKGVWDEGIIGRGARDERLIKVNRMNCFFFLYNPGMMFAAADELQMREQEANAIKTSNLYTRIGLWIASGALLINSFISYFQPKLG